MPPIKRRDLLRQSLLGMVAGSLFPDVLRSDVIAAADVLRILGRSDWRPVFVTAQQDELLVNLCELIIPVTDTPGAKEALVNRFLDYLMAVQPPDTQNAFLAALNYIDQECQKRYGSVFVQTSPVLQVEFLTFIAYPHTYPTWGDHTIIATKGNTYFNQLKGWISGAYYSSEIGLKELGWDGTPPHGELAGCGHASHGLVMPPITKGN